MRPLGNRPNLHRRPTEDDTTPFWEAQYPRHRRRSVLTLSLSLVLAVMLVFIIVPAVAAQDVYSPETLKISRKLQCPVCAGQSVADSGSQLAAQMRDIIEQKVQAGESEQQIIDYFVARYGASIATEPPKSGISLGLWWMPVAVVVFGAIVVGLFVRERTQSGARRQVDAVGPDGDEELEAIAREVLGPQGGERMSGA